MTRIRVEFTVFPFREGPEPPPHARAAIDALVELGLPVEVGPFGTAVTGEADLVLHALARAHGAALQAGASRLVTNLTVEGVPLDGIPHMTGALERLLAAAESHIGKPVDDMSRAEKQRVVRFLDERGAFELRKAVETVADALGVSRFTIYNYLDASRNP